MRKGILCFIRNNQRILLLKVDYGSRIIWTGVSGYVEDGETIPDTVIREVREEIGVELNKDDLVYKGDQRISEDLSLGIFIVSKWEGEPKPQEESIKEIRLFDVDKMPYDQMPEGNESWLPQLLK